MTRPLPDDTRPGIATETTYTFERAPCPRRILAVLNNYRITPVEPVSKVGPFIYAVRRWCWGAGVGIEVGTVEGATPDDGIAKAREVAADDWDRQHADPSPTWWRGVGVVR